MRNRTSAAIVGLLAVALVATTAPAWANTTQPPPATTTHTDATQPPGGFATWEDLYAEQAERTAQWEAIQAAAEAAGDTGYAGTNVDPTAPAIILRWRGTPSPAVQAAIKEQGTINPIELLPARHSEAELIAEAQRIGQSPGVNAVVPNPDASGLTVTWNPGATDHALAAQTIASARVAVEFAPNEAPEPPQLLSRQNDTSPWKGGARTANCTTGFAVTMNGSAHLMYAAHCLESTTRVVDGAGDFIGTGGNRVISADTAMVGVGNSRGQVWDGGYHSNYLKPVRAAAPALVGDYFCSSGALTGVVCNNQVTHVGISHGAIGPLVRFVNRSGTPTVGQGDSGGPMYATRSDGGVTALGILSSGDPDRRASSCTGEGGRICYTGGHMIDARGFLNRYNATIRTY